MKEIAPGVFVPDNGNGKPAKMMHEGHEHTELALKENGRKPNGIELALKIDKLDAEVFLPSYASLKQRILDVQDDMIRDAVKFATKKIASGGKLTPANFRTFKTQNKPHFEQIVKECRKAGKKMFRLGRERGRWEAAQVKSWGGLDLDKKIPREKPHITLSVDDVFDELDPSTFDKYMETTYWDTARRVEDRLLDVLIAQTVDQYMAGQLSVEEFNRALMAMSDQAIDLLAKKIPNRTWLTGRIVELDKAGFQYVMRSGILDRRICSVCAPKDGRTAKVGTPEFDLLKAPDPRCEGGSFLCRCMLIYFDADNINTHERIMEDEIKIGDMK